MSLFLCAVVEIEIPCLMVVSSRKSSSELAVCVDQNHISKLPSLVFSVLNNVQAVERTTDNVTIHAAVYQDLAQHTA
jgi:hypothetical protein